MVGETSGGMKTVCVFCGSSSGADPAYVGAARLVGKLVAASGVRLVYGGGRVGLMGALADAAIAAGGEVVGVIPKALVDRELAHRGVTDLRVVGSLHERKALMYGMSDAFITLPGGLGTLEEFFEAWTLAQLGLLPKPIGLLEVNGFFTPLLNYLDGVVGSGLIRPDDRQMLLVDSDPESLLRRMAGG